MAQDLLQPTSREDKQAPGDDGGLTFQAGVSNAVVVGEDLHRDEEG